MPYPVVPPIDYSYTDFQESQGDNQFPGTFLDNDLFNFQYFAGEVVNFLKFSFRDDGQLNNAIVPPQALAPATLALIGSPTPRGNWLTATAYAVRDIVSQSSKTWLCAAAHTSGVFATDQAAGKWLLMAEPSIGGQQIPIPSAPDAGKVLFATGAGTVAYQSIVFPTIPPFPVADATQLATPMVPDNPAVNNGPALLAALRTAGRTVVVPKGTYYFNAVQNVGLLGHVRLQGEPGTVFKFNNGSQLATAFLIVTGGYDLMIEGIEIDADNRVAQPLRIQQIDTAGTNSGLFLDRVKIRNARCAVGDATGPTALNIQGGFRGVYLRDCLIADTTRPAGSGTPGTSGCVGAFVGRYSGNPTLLYPRLVVVDGTVIQNVSTEAALDNSENVDCDGLIMFGGQDANTANPGLLVVRNCMFAECAGRAIKVQHDMAVIVDNYIRRSTKPANAPMDISAQTGHAVVERNTFDYRPWVSGTEQAYLDRMTSVGVYVGAGSDRDIPVGGVIRDNTVFLTATGALQQFAWLEQTTTAAEADRAFTALSGNRLLGSAKWLGRLYRFGADAAAKAHLLCVGNYVADLQAALLALDFTPMPSARLVMRDNVNHGSTPRAFVAHSDGTTPVVPGTLVKMSNIGFLTTPEITDTGTAVASVVLALEEGVTIFDIDLTTATGTAGFAPVAELSFDGGGTWTSSGFYGHLYLSDNGTSANALITNLGGAPFSPGGRLTTSGDVKQYLGHLRLVNVAGRQKLLTSDGQYQNSAQTGYGRALMACRLATTTLATHIRFRDTAGANIDAGTRITAKVQQ